LSHARRGGDSYVMSQYNVGTEIISVNVYVFYTVSQKKHVTTFFAITGTMNVRL